MSQSLQPFGTNPAAEEQLRMSETAMGQGGMGNGTAPVGPNSFDAGAASKVGVNTQPYNNDRLKAQNTAENALKSGVPGQQAAARSELRAKTNAENNAQAYANRAISEFTFANAADAKNTALFALGHQPTAELIDRDVKMQQMIAANTNPQMPYTSNRLPV